MTTRHAAYNSTRFLTSADDGLTLEHGVAYFASMDAPFEVFLPHAAGCLGQLLSITFVGGGAELTVTAQSGESVITTHGTQSVGGSQKRRPGSWPLQVMELVCVDFGFAVGHFELPRPISTYQGGSALPFPRLAIVKLDASTQSGDDSEILTADANGALVIEGESASANDLVLVADPLEHDKNGYWIVTDAGSGATPWVLRRWDPDYVQANSAFGRITKPWEGKSRGRLFLGLGGTGNPLRFRQIDAAMGFGHRHRREHISLTTTGGPTAIVDLNPADGEGRYELLVNGNGLMCEVRAFAHDEVLGDTASYVKIARFSRLLGIVTLKGVDDVSTAEDDATWDVGFDVSGDFARVLLTSDAINNTQWVVLIGWYETPDPVPP